MTHPTSTTPVEDGKANPYNVIAIAKRAELAAKIAKSLCFFPLSCPKGEDANEYYKCLEVSFTYRITEMLNEAANVK